MIQFNKNVLDVSVPYEQKNDGLHQRKLTENITVLYQGTPIDTIHAGFVSDSMSMPRFARWYWSDNWKLKYASASVYHDYLLKHSFKPKWEIDWLFMGALRSCGVSALEAGIFWLAVRTRRPGKKKA